jgi:lysophospholipase L1-like esterase
MRRTSVLILAFTLGGCADDPVYTLGGADTGGTTDVSTDSGADVGVDVSVDVDLGGACETATPTGTSVAGQLYVDVDQSERSLWDGGSFAAPDEGIAARAVTLYGPDGPVETVTCADGTFGFSDLNGRTYVTAVEWEEGDLCRTRNCQRGLAAALDRGRVKIVTLGDSVPVVGDAPFFPQRLADMLAPLADVENVNIAVGGTTSVDWVPGTPNFDQRFEPHIDSADIVIVSVGGNDFLEYANGAFGNPSEAIAGFPDFVREVMGRVLLVKDTVAVRNPDADLVYLLYPDYSQSQSWADQFGFAISVIQGLVEDALEQILDELGPEEDIVMVDFYGFYRETGLDLDTYLYDMLHFNDAGQQVYAERIFEALGGVLIADEIGTASRYALEP